MNKEEIKKAIKIIFNEECKKCYFPRKRSCESCLKENRKKIRKYIKELEQKESILDKVKEIAKYFDTTENTIRTAIARKSKRNCRYIIIKVAD